MDNAEEVLIKAVQNMASASLSRDESLLRVVDKLINRVLELEQKIDKLVEINSEIARH